MTNELLIQTRIGLNGNTICYEGTENPRENVYSFSAINMIVPMVD